MRIIFTKEYTRKNETPCVLIYCNERDIFWLGKKESSTQYKGLTQYKSLNYENAKKCVFFFEENTNYTTVSKHLDKYYISESDFNFLIDKIKTRNDFNRVVDSMVEL